MNFFISNLISIAAAGLAAVLLLNRFFKNSVFVRVGIVWLFNLLFIMFMVGLKYKFFEDNKPVVIAITLSNIIVSVICFYYGSIAVVKPLSKSVEKLEEISNGNLDVEIDTKDVTLIGTLVNLSLPVKKLNKTSLRL